MKSNNDCPVLITLGACAEYLNVSKAMVSSYIKKGMPCWIEGNTWHFHKDRIAEYFYIKCACKYDGKTNPMEIEDADLKILVK